YALVFAHDCRDNGIDNAVAGFSPAPDKTGYLDGTGAFSAALHETSALGLVAGLGFSATSSTAPASVTSAVGVTRDGTCTESFSGGSFKVWPDSVTVWSTSKGNVLHH